MLLFARQARSIDIDESFEDPNKIPFQSKHGWKNIQSQCKDMRKAVSYIKTNTRPGIRGTKIEDVKRYQQQDLVLDSDGLLMARGLLLDFYTMKQVILKLVKRLQSSTKGSMLLMPKVLLMMLSRTPICATPQTLSPNISLLIVQRLDQSNLALMQQQMYSSEKSRKLWFSGRF
jgi:hypothetical protein